MSREDQKGSTKRLGLAFAMATFKFLKRIVMRPVSRTRCGLPGVLGPLFPILPMLAGALGSDVAANGSEDVGSRPEGIRIALFTDPHFTKGRRKNTTPRMPYLAKDANHRIRGLDFAMGLGDEVHDHAGWIGIWKRDLVRHLNLPYHFSPGDHDVVDYYWKDEPKSRFPYKVLTGFMRESELTTPSYAMMRSNILFLVIGDKGPILKIHETQKRWVEHMVATYPDKTTILVSHAAIRGTTKASNRHDWGWRHSEMWWWNLFHDNPQIKAYIHGDGHALSYTLTGKNDRFGYKSTNGSWGHKIAFIEPGGHSLLRDKHNRNQFIVLEIDKQGLTTRAWRNEEEPGGWVDVYDHQWSVPEGTTYDKDGSSWYSFPLFFQDGEEQAMRNDVVPFGPVEMRLVGVDRYSLFNNAELIAGHTGPDKVAGFENTDRIKEYRRRGEMVVAGPATLEFPDKHTSREKGGKSGQIKGYIQHGSVPQVVPGAVYEISVTARSKSGKGTLKASMSCSVWDDRNQYSRLSGSGAEVLRGKVGEELTTLTGTYTAPEDPKAWFLQGKLRFRDSTRYTVEAFRIHRRTEAPHTKDFQLTLNGKTYREGGVLEPGESAAHSVQPRALTDHEGRLRFRAHIGGNRQGMARLVFRSPLLLGRNGLFRIDRHDARAVEITLLEAAGRFSSRFKLFPYTDAANGLTVNPGQVERSDSGHPHAQIPAKEKPRAISIRLPDREN